MLDAATAGGIPVDVKSPSSSSAARLTTMTDAERAALARIHSILLLTLDNTRLQMVMHVAEGDAVGVWRELQRHYERDTTASKAHTRAMMHKTKMKSGDDFDLYKSKMIALATRLRAMGEPVSESELKYVIMEGLPGDYAMLKQSLEIQDELDFEKMCIHIRDRQEQLNLREIAADEEVESASLVRAKGGRGQSQRAARGKGGERESHSDRGDRRPRAPHSESGSDSEDPESSWRCGLCKRIGHYERYCKKRKGTGRACFRCGGEDHQMRDCRGDASSKPDRGLGVFERREEVQW